MKRNKIILLVVFILFIVVLLALCGKSNTKETEEIEETRLDNIIFQGIDNSTYPLSATDLVLLQSGSISEYGTSYTYTIIGTLQKNSAEPVESFFEFSVVLIDEYGRHIATEQTNTMPETYWGHDSRELLTNGSTYHFELEIRTPSNKTPTIPVAVEFVDIKEFSKEEFIRITLDDAKNKIDKQYYNDARRVVEFLLQHAPNNEEALALLEQVILLESQENSENPSISDENNSGEEEALTLTSENELSDFEKAVAENPNAVKVQDGFLGPDVLLNVEILETDYENSSRIVDYVDRHHSNAVSLIESGYEAGYIPIYVKLSVTHICSSTGLTYYKFDPGDFGYMDSNGKKLDSSVIADNGFDENIEVGDYTIGGFVVQVQTDEIPKLLLGNREFTIS